MDLGCGVLWGWLEGKRSFQGQSKVFWDEILTEHSAAEVYRQLLVCLFVIEIKAGTFNSGWVGSKHPVAVVFLDVQEIIVYNLSRQTNSCYLDRYCHVVDLCKFFFDVGSGISAVKILMRTGTRTQRCASPLCKWLNLLIWSPITHKLS